MTGALAGHSAALGRQGKRPASTLASTPASAQAPLHSAGISSKGKPGQEITLPWKPERPFQTQGKIKAFWLDLTPTKPGWSQHLVREALVFLGNGQWPLLQGLTIPAHSGSQGQGHPRAEGGSPFSAPT